MCCQCLERKVSVQGTERKSMDWKKIVKDIEIKEEMKEELVENCRKKKHTVNGMFRYSKAAAVVVGIAVCSMVSLTAYAAVSAYRARLKAMDKEEMQELYDTEIVGNGEAYRYSRKMTESEQERMKLLRYEYENGLFPEGEISKEVVEGGFYYDIATRTYMLPERELTDEEILQILDMWAKVDYSLQQINKEKEETGEIYAKEETVSGEAVEVTADNAAYLRAKEIVEGVCEMDLGNCEVEITYHDSDTVTGSEGYYFVVFYKEDKKYMVTLRVYDGEMSRIPGNVRISENVNLGDIEPGEEPVEWPTAEVTEKMLQTIYEKAEQLAVNVLGVEEKIVAGHCLYDGTTETSRIVVLLETESGERYKIGFSATTGKVTNELTYGKDTYSDVEIMDSYRTVVQMK